MNASLQGGELRNVQTRPISFEFVSLEDMKFDHRSQKKKSLRTRYIYGFIFLMTNLCAWFLRDYGERIIPQLRYLKSCGNKGKECFHTLGVLRVSLGCFVSFFRVKSREKISALIPTITTFDITLSRNWWSFKLLLFMVSMVLPFFFHPGVIQLYGELARVGAGIFLLLQLVSVIQFISWWNKYWMPDEKKKESCSLGLFMSTVFYVGSFSGIGLMYMLYAPTASCALNIFFITWTVVLLIVMMAVSLHSKVNRGLLSSGIMASYVVFLCWSAIRSEPATGTCIAQKQASKNCDWTTVLSFLIAVCAVVMATFSTGIDSQSFQFRKEGVKEEDDIPYKYGFFHLVFSLGAMYFAMLFISWNLNNSARKWSIDVGWASTWVKIINEWFAATIFLWTLISPALRETKVGDLEESTQQTENTAIRD